MAGAFRQLAVYRLAAELADEVYEIAVRFPRLDRGSLGIQLIRAADSVGANIAEAAGRWHEADKRRLLMIARGSLYEVEHWLLRAGAQRADQTPELGAVNCQLSTVNSNFNHNR